MALEIFWRLSTAAAVDARRAEWSEADRPWVPVADNRSRRLQINRYDYLTQVARAAELTGFDGVYVPDDPQGEEPWIVTGTLVRETRRLKLVTEVAPGSASAVYHAKMAASLQRFSGGRQAWAIDLNVPAEQRARQGDFVAQAEQAERARELLTLSDGIWGPGPFDQAGEYFVVEQGGLGGLVANAARPEAWIQGDEEAVELAALQGDVYLLPPLPIGRLAESVARLKARPIRIAAQIEILAREEQRDLAVEQSRVAPAANRLSGTYDEVAAALEQLAAAGLDIALVFAPDQIREVHIVGEQIISRLRAPRPGDRAAA